jgi:hypothetical protein
MEGDSPRTMAVLSRAGPGRAAPGAGRPFEATVVTSGVDRDTLSGSDGDDVHAASGVDVDQPGRGRQHRPSSRCQWRPTVRVVLRRRGTPGLHAT